MEEIRVIVTVLGILISATLTLFVVAWKYFLKDIKDNKRCIRKLERKHDEDIDDLRGTIHEEFERMQNYVSSTASLGQDDHDLLQRIDERVNRLQSNMDDMKEKIDYIHDKNGGNK